MSYPTLVFLVVLCAPAFGIELAQNCSSYNASAVTNFTAIRVSGKWYEVESYSNYGYCTTADVTAINSTELYVDVNTYTNLTARTNTSYDIWATLENNTTGQFQVHMANQTAQSQLVANYVLATDFQNYAVVWSCQDVENGSYQELVIVSRKETLSPEYRTAINDTLTSYNISQSELKLVEQNSTICHRTGGAGALTFSLATVFFAISLQLLV